MNINKPYALPQRNPYFLFAHNFDKITDIHTFGRHSPREIRRKTVHNYNISSTVCVNCTSLLCKILIITGGGFTGGAMVADKWGEIFNVRLLLM